MEGEGESEGEDLSEGKVSAHCKLYLTSLTYFNQG